MRLASIEHVALRAHLAAWLMLTAGCGGIAEGRSPAPGPDDDKTSPAPAHSDDTASQTPLGGGTELGDCRRGPIESYSQPCPWVADRRCYTAREMACNCTCPRSRDSVCLSGFEAGDDGHVEVSCD